ncbi:GreA/GreB family elongation factor [Algoriphagus sp.]|jgi:regulator of nucleoside diphosphate kinase|uniref:GreA/GreB family elongation factor n=1 Tax=Algoriphagus sp. TaxID=1872435 RepID=UPI0027187927|nr:GreA/GreB family elongation factor [Algoriphagus sp.]MDO8966079.1 GreA/GreB family elongation factor [Algoriphagus sp.]MDP3199244.1 GreA/GreB family elongation factor [Algoriphagus sp.]
MKPFLTASDYKTIHTLILNLPPQLKGKEVIQLQHEIKSAEIVPDGQLSPDIIQINSYFEVLDLETQRLMKFQVVLPHLADLKQFKISILSPLGVAMIGFRQGMTVEWTLPGGRKRLQINQVDNPIRSTQI